MTQILTRLSGAAWLLAAGLLISGCSPSEDPDAFTTDPGGKSGKEKATSKDPDVGTTTGSAEEPQGVESEDGKHWKDYPDVPYVAVMTEVDGIPIPRIESRETKSLSIKGALPVDPGNEWAKEHPSKPERGDAIIVRMAGEPKSLNPLTESSASQTYIMDGNVLEALVRRNPETMEFEPLIASKWIADDSIKLSADSKGKERRVALDGGDAKAELTAEYPAKKGEKDPEPVLKFTTTDKDGKAAPETWVGLFPDGEVLGAPKTGYQFWSDSTGVAAVSGLVPGKYIVKVGVEVFGKSKKNEDGSLVVTPSEGEPYTLAKGEWSDVQAETVFTFTMREDVKWSDGEPYTTRDLRLGYDAVRSEHVDAPHLRVYYEDLVRCEPLGPYQIRMQYRQQYFMAFDFSAGLQSVPWHIFEKTFKDKGLTLTSEPLTAEEEKAQKKVSVHGEAFGEVFNQHAQYNDAPLGTGPYKVKEWTHKDKVELVRNEIYWNKERAGWLDRIVFKFIDLDTTAFQAFKAGEIDFFYLMNAEQYYVDLDGPPDWFKDKYVKARWYTPVYSYFGWNMTPDKPLFQDRRVRLAMSLLINKAEFRDLKLHGAAEFTTGTQYYFGPMYDHSVKPLAYDPETAKELLAAAGWLDTNNDGILDKDGTKFEFELSLPKGNSLVRQQAELVQKSLRDVGVIMKVTESDWASYIDKVKTKKADAMRLSWTQGPESDPFQVWHSKGADPNDRGSNHVAFKNDLADQLIEMQRVTLDEKKRKKINASFQRLLDQEQPYTFLWVPMEHGAYNKRFRGVKWYRLRPGFDLTEWYVPKDEQVYKN